MSDVFDFHGRVGNRTVDLPKKRKFSAVIEKKYFRSRRTIICLLYVQVFSGQKNHRCFHFLSFQRSFTRFFFSDKFLFRASVALHLPADWEFSKLGRPLCREFWTIIFRSFSMTFRNLFAMLFLIYYPQYCTV